ncbi:MAG: hypothetical protein R6V07_20340 [Armatimonadota bacterium]
MPEVIERRHQSDRHAQHRVGQGITGEKISPRCRYRRELAGFYVCRATNHVAIVTGTDCGKCPVPETLKKVDCFFLQANVKLAPTLTVEWRCGATDDLVDTESPSGCLDCL